MIYFIIKNGLYHAVIREVKVGKKTRYQVLTGDFAKKPKEMGLSTSINQGNI